MQKHWGALLALTFLMTGSGHAAPADPEEAVAIRGVETVQGRSPAWIYADHKKLDAAIASLAPQRAGVVDAYVLSVGLDGDPVFGRESAEAARVLSSRYNASGRTLLLAAGGGAGAASAANGSPSNLTIALGGVAEKMDRAEDVLVLYVTTHGGPKIGLAFKDGDYGYGLIAPQRLKDMLDGFGFKRRLIILSACFSGAFVAPLTNDDSVIVTAASSATTSFGCAPSADWTFFGDALINNALRDPAPLGAAVNKAFGLILQWEGMRGLPASNPQFALGAHAKDWLDALDAAVPKMASAKVGRPAISN